MQTTISARRTDQGFMEANRNEPPEASQGTGRTQAPIPTAMDKVSVETERGSVTCSSVAWSAGFRTHSTRSLQIIVLRLTEPRSGSDFAHGHAPTPRQRSRLGQWAFRRGRE